MTEAEWNAFQWPLEPLEFLAGRASQRKLRLFTAACCRQIWRFLKHEELRRLVLVSEQFADKRITEKEFEKAYTAVIALEDPEGNDAEMNAVISAAATPLEPFHCTDCAEEAADAIFMEASAKVPKIQGKIQIKITQGIRLEHLKKQVVALRCIFGPLPFRSVAVESVWLTPTVKQLAQAIYDERAFDRLPILADALEDGGCTNADILSHCRGAGPHVLGCWVVDLLLGKE